MKLSLVVLKSLDPQGLSEFYKTVGFEMVVEQHANGPIHYAAVLSIGKIEIYPTKISAKTMFGLDVNNVLEFKSKWLSAGGKLGKGDNMLLDPDGNTLWVAETPAA